MADEKKIKGKPFKCSDELYVSEKKLKEELTKEREKAAYNAEIAASEREGLEKEREKAAHNAGVELVFTFA